MMVFVVRTLADHPSPKDTKVSVLLALDGTRFHPIFQMVSRMSVTQ